MLISIYSVIKGTKRDKRISIGVFLVCLLCFTITEWKINTHNEKAKMYLGTHQLLKYRNSTHYYLNIAPNNKYYVFDQVDTIATGTWELSISSNNSTLLLLDGRILGTGEFALK